jgi:hypothetical protein
MTRLRRVAFGLPTHHPIFGSDSRIAAKLDDAGAAVQEVHLGRAEQGLAGRSAEARVLHRDTVVERANEARGRKRGVPLANTVVQASNSDAG